MHFFYCVNPYKNFYKLILFVNHDPLIAVTFCNRVFLLFYNL